MAPPSGPASPVPPPEPAAGRPDPLALPTDPNALFAHYLATLPAAGRLRANMVVSLDGRTTIDARSGGLSGDADRRVFAALRAQCDAVLVGAGTARSEHYRPATVRAEFAESRRAHGFTEPPVIALVSRSLDLPPDLPLLTDPRTVIVTCAAASADDRARLASRVRVVVAGDATVDPNAAVAALTDLGLGRLLCEGGPTLLADAMRSELVDELCLTIAPVVVGDRGPSLITGDLDQPARWTPEPPRMADGMLFTRFRAVREEPPHP